MSSQPSTKKFLTVTQIVNQEFNRLTDEELAHLETISLEDMLGFHHTAGMGIRNEYHLWDKENPLTAQWFADNEAGQNKYLKDGVDYSPFHPDAVSNDILKYLWVKVHEQ